MKPALERPLPYSADAERSVLGAILLDNNALSAASEGVQPGDFFLDQHRRIFKAMLGLAEFFQPLDLVTLAEHLDRHNELEAAGGSAYLAQLMDGMPRATNVAHYARIVKEKAVLRQLIRTAEAIQQRAFDGQIDAAQIALLEDLKDGRGVDGCRAMFHSWEELEAAKSLTFAIRGFLQNKGATMIGGLSGHGKTLILLSITRALLRGKGTKLWNLFEVQQENARVVYLIPESALEPFKHRLQLFDVYPFCAPDSERLLVRTLSKGPTPSLSDSRILAAARGAHVILDTAVRFGEGDENEAGDNRRLASDIFALISAGATSVLCAHHSPKPFAKENVMRLENVLRGSGDIGAVQSAAYGVKQIDPEQNILHIETLKTRDFEPGQPFQLVGRPYINEEGDFRLYKAPGECGSLMEEQEPQRDKGGAPAQTREAKAANMELLRQWTCESPVLSSQELSQRFHSLGIKLGASSIRKYRKELGV